MRKSAPKISLGVHSGHNSAAVLVKEGAIDFGIQEERYSRLKNQGGIPRESIRAIQELTKTETGRLAFSGTNISDAAWERDHIKKLYSNADHSLLKHVKASIRRIGFIERSLNSTRLANITDNLVNTIGCPSLEVDSFDHHLCHAASAYYGAGNMTDRMLVLTCDGSGDGICATVSIGQAGSMERIAKVDLSHSVGRFYANITFLMGMVPLEHEYKIMGLAPYAEKSSESRRMADEFMSLFEFDQSNPMVWRRTFKPAMQYSLGFLEKMTRRTRFDHVAAGAQLFMENFLVKWVTNCMRESSLHKVVLGGGVFMNVKANQKILQIPELESLFVFPSCGDESNAIGAAYLSYHKNYGSIPHPVSNYYLGDQFNNAQVEEAIGDFEFSANVEVSCFENIEEEVARLLSVNEIVARFKNRMEFGARAMGNRSILANPANPDVVVRINEMIKNRDFWMPFAPSVLSEKSGDYFEKPKEIVTPYMMITLDSKPEKREQIIAALHPCDFTGRPQEVVEDLNPAYHALLMNFEQLTGESLILNTSFNLHGEPIVRSPKDALRVFDVSGLDFLAIENFLVKKVRS